MLTATLAGHAVASTQPLHARPSLIAETTGAVPGKALALAVTFEIDPHWHLYWNGRNDTGFAPEVRITAPAGYEVGLPAWPAPTRLVQPGDVLDHVYENRLTLIVPVQVPKDATGTVEFRASLHWLVCERVCLPESAEVSLTLPIVEAGQITPSPHAREFVSARAATPRPLAAAKGAVTTAVSELKLHIESPGATRLAFFPATLCSETPNLVSEGESKGAALAVTLDATAGRVAGIIAVSRPGAKVPEHYAVDFTYPEPKESSPGGTASTPPPKPPAKPE